MFFNPVPEQGLLRVKTISGRLGILIKLSPIKTYIVSIFYKSTGSISSNYCMTRTLIPLFGGSGLYAKRGQSKPILNIGWNILTENRSILLRNGYNGIYHTKKFKSFSEE